MKDESLDNLDVVSSTECTGLIQIPPENSAQAEAYSDIYSSVPERVNKQKARFRHKRIK